MAKDLLQDVEWLTDQYATQNKSSYAIAEELNVNQSRVYRAIKKLGITRDASEAQKVSLKENRRKHPTKGKKRTDAERLAISAGKEKFLQNLDDDEKQEYKEMLSAASKKYWETVDPERRQAIMKENHKRVRQTAKHGSKLERVVWNVLAQAGYNDAIPHQKGLVPNSKLEVDIWVPSLGTAIEIDGPSHFKPIYGEEKLRKTQQQDRQKSGLILGAGYIMVRIKCIKNKPSQIQLARLGEQLVEALDKISKGLNKSSNRFINLEIEDDNG